MFRNEYVMPGISLVSQAEDMWVVRNPPALPPQRKVESWPSKQPSQEDERCRLGSGQAEKEERF